MPDLRRRTCMVCGRSDSEVGAISWRGNCAECGHYRAEQCMDEMHYKRGPIYRRWQRRIVEGALKIELDDAPLPAHTER